MSIPARFLNFTAEDIRREREETGCGMMEIRRRRVIRNVEQAIREISFTDEHLGDTLKAILMIATHEI